MMFDIANLPDDQLEALKLAIRSEQDRRRARCPACGGHMKVWHLHLCDEEGGANLPMASEAARRLTAGSRV